MAEIKLIPAVCPKCGASLNLPENAQHLYCMYCGTRVYVGRADVDQKVECNVCDGYGRVDICRACNGTGKCTWYTRAPGHRGNDLLSIGFSSTCDDGTCSACNGTGKWRLGICPGCGGTGKCPRCFGNGQCLACRGAGSIPNRQGYERCGNCEGTGMVDPGEVKKRKSPVASECSQCGNIVVTCAMCGGQIQDKSPVCPNCGHARRKCPQCDAYWVLGATYCRSCGFGKAQASSDSAQGQ